MHREPPSGCLISLKSLISLQLNTEVASSSGNQSRDEKPVHMVSNTEIFLCLIVLYFHSLHSISFLVKSIEINRADLKSVA